MPIDISVRQPDSKAGASGTSAPSSNVRWGICALLFFATTINYVDRSVLGVLAPLLRKEIGWTDSQYGEISAAFTLAYAIGFLFAGWFIDRFGTRIGYALYLIVWSLAAAGHALAATAMGFGLARFALGLGESGNFPAAVKTVAEWFPRKERALATGIFNAGSNVGAILAPLVVPALTLQWSWRASFTVTGLMGLVWVLFWWPLYRRPAEHPRLGAEELRYIESDPSEPTQSVTWLELLRHRQAWAFAVGKFLTDSVWWFYLFWFPLFMADRFGFDLKNIGLPLVTVYLLADVGSVGGGWLSSNLLKRGWSANAARKTAMLVCALLILPVAMAPRVAGPWVAVWLVGMAAAAHQGFSANMFTLASDMFPKSAIGSVVGFGGFAGAMGGFLMNLGAGWFRQNQGNYVTMFTIAGVAYLIALASIHTLAPRLEAGASRRSQMKLHSIFIQTAVVLLLAALAGCGNSANKSETKKVKLAFVTNNPADFWTLARKGTEAADKELDNVDVEFQIADGTAADQRRIVDDLLTKGVTGIAISPIDPANQTQMINDIAKKGVVITQDSDAPESNRMAYIGTDNVAAGKQAGELIQQALPNGGKIMLFVGKKDTQNAKERYEGIRQVLAGTKVQILDVKTDDADEVRAKANAADTIVRYPDVAALIGLFSYNGPAIVSALKEAKKLGKIQVVCFDDDPSTIAGIMEGSIYGTIVQQPYEFGYQAIKLMNKILAGDKSDIPPTKQRFIPTLAVTKANVNDYSDKINKLKGGS